MRRLAVVAALAAALGCTTNEIVNVLGPSSAGGAAGSESVTSVRIEPSQFELVNGQGATAEVRAFVGAIEARDFEFSVSVEPNQSVLTIIRIVGTRIDIKAERPGNTSLIVTIRPGVEARAPVTVVNAN